MYHPQSTQKTLSRTYIPSIGSSSNPLVMITASSNQSPSFSFTDELRDEHEDIPEKAKFDDIVNHIEKCGNDRRPTKLKPPSYLDPTLVKLYGGDAEMVVRDKNTILLYDLTVPLMKHCAERNVKCGLFMHGGVIYRIRNGKEYKLRPIDFDYVGSAAPMVQEVECFRLMGDIFIGLNLKKVIFKFNHCGLLLLVLKIHGVMDEDYQKRVLKILAQAHPKDLSLLEAKLTAAGVNQGLSSKLVEYIGQRDGLQLLDSLERDLITLQDAKRIIDELRWFLKSCGDLPYKVSFEIDLIRDMKYYTGLVFEAICADTGESRIIACGGRYDNLSSQLQEGYKLPSVGFSLRTETLYEVCHICAPLSLEQGEMVRPLWPVPKSLYSHLVGSRPPLKFEFCDPSEFHQSIMVFSISKAISKPPLTDSTVAEETATEQVKTTHNSDIIEDKLVAQYVKEGTITDPSLPPIQEKGPT